jgi:hypothetical protein
VALPEEDAMEAAYWLEQAAKFRERAETTADQRLMEELLELAAICEEVADEIEHRAAAG